MDKPVTGPPPKTGQLKAFFNKYRRSKDPKSTSTDQKTTEVVQPASSCSNVRNITEDVQPASSRSNVAPRNITSDLQHNGGTNQLLVWPVFVQGSKQSNTSLFMTILVDYNSASSFITPCAFIDIKRYVKTVTVRPLSLKHQLTYRNPRLGNEYKATSSVKIDIANNYLKFTSTTCDVCIPSAVDENDWKNAMESVDIILGRNFIERNGGRALLEQLADLYRVNNIRKRASSLPQLTTNVVEAEVLTIKPQDTETPVRRNIDSDIRSDVHTESGKKPESVSLGNSAKNTLKTTTPKSIPISLTKTEQLMQQIDTSARRASASTTPDRRVKGELFTDGVKKFMNMWTLLAEK